MISESTSTPSQSKMTRSIAIMGKSGKQEPLCGGCLKPPGIHHAGWEGKWADHPAWVPRPRAAGERCRARACRGRGGEGVLQLATRRNRYPDRLYDLSFT